MIYQLARLISDASTILGSDACREGKHDWTTEGARSCPDDIDAPCSQAVYRCRTCGDYDYGERGGPGHADCQRCSFKTAITKGEKP